MHITGYWVWTYENNIGLWLWNWNYVGVWEEWPAPGLCPGSVGWKSFVTPSYCGFLVSSNSKVWRCHVAVYSAALAISSIMFSWVVTCSLISIFSGLPWTEKVPWKVIKERKIALTMNPSFELAIMFRECEALELKLF